RRPFVRSCSTPAAAVRSVFHLLSRPHQRRLCRADHEHGPGLHRDGLCVGGHRVLLGLLPVRGAEQHHSRKSRRADMDRRIMITWGLFSGATAFVTGATSFAAVRFFLGVSEAGFFPGMILYFTYWFPARCRGQVIGWFMTAIPVAIFLGGPISTSLLVQLDGLFGLASWRWLFLCEAAPAIILG